MYFLSEISISTPIDFEQVITQINKTLCDEGWNNVSEDGMLWFSYFETACLWWRKGRFCSVKMKYSNNDGQDIEILLFTDILWTQQRTHTYALYTCICDKILKSLYSPQTLKIRSTSNTCNIPKLLNPQKLL